MNEKASEYITGHTQFLNIRNYMFIRDGSLTSRPGTTDFATLPLSSYPTQPRGLYEFIQPSGVSFLMFDSGPTLYALQGSPAAKAISLTPGATIGYNLEFETFENYLFFANGYSHQRFDGSYSVFYGVPEGLSLMATFGATFNTGVSVNGATAVITAGFKIFRFAYCKYGPTYAVGPVGLRADNALGSSMPGMEVGVSTAAITNQGAWVVWGFTIPPGYGISSILPYQSGTNNLSFAAYLSPVSFFLTTYGGVTLYTMQFANITSDSIPDVYSFFTLVPRYISTFKNMYFMAGFSSYPSRIYFSNIGTPDKVNDENYFDVRPGNGDEITNITLFQDSLIIFKKNSVHQLTGYDPSSLALKDVTLEYGCLSQNGSVVFNNKLWFIDRRGICEFNGPSTFVVSYPVEETLSTVDKTKCRTFHNKKRREIWFSFGQKTFVFDYNSEIWSIFDNLPMESAKGGAILNFETLTQDVAFSDVNGSFITFSRFKDDVFTDRGQPITLMAKTRFHKRAGDTTQEMWRRLFLNADGVSGSVNATVNFYGDYSAGSSLTRNITLNDGHFQYRIDYGVSAKTLSVEFIIQASQQIIINGYTVESRYLRSV